MKECILCGSKDNQQSRYDSWGKMERVYLEKHLGVSPHNQCFICKKHLVEARRHGHELDHIPSWKSSSNDLQSSKQQCSNPHCNNSECDKLIKAMFTTSDKLSKLFGLEPTGEPFVTGPAKTGHVGTNYTPSPYRSYLSIRKVYFHSVTCSIMPIKCLLRAKNCNAIA